MQEEEEWGGIVCRMRNLEGEAMKDWRADLISGRRRCIDVMLASCVAIVLLLVFHRPELRYTRLQWSLRFG